MAAMSAANRSSPSRCQSVSSIPLPCDEGKRLTVGLDEAGARREPSRFCEAELALELDRHASRAKRQPGALLRAVQAKDHALVVLHDRVVFTLDDGSADLA